MTFLKTTALALVLSAGLFMGSSHASAHENEASLATMHTSRLASLSIQTQVDAALTQGGGLGVCLPILKKVLGDAGISEATLDTFNTFARKKAIKTYKNVSQLDALLETLGLPDGVPFQPSPARNDGFMSMALSQEALEKKATLTLKQQEDAQRAQESLAKKIAAIKDQADAKQLFKEQEEAAKVTRRHLETAQHDFADIQRQLKAAGEEINRRDETIKKLENTINDANLELVKKGKQADLYVKDLNKGHAAKIEDLQENLTLEVNAKKESGQLVVHLNAELGTKSEEIEELTKKLGAAKLEAAKVSDLNQQISDLDANLTQAQGDLKTACEEMVTLIQKVAGLEKGLGEERVKLKDANTNILDRNAQIQKLGEKVEDLNRTAASGALANDKATEKLRKEVDQLQIDKGNLKKENKVIVDQTDERDLKITNIGEKLKTASQNPGITKSVKAIIDEFFCNDGASA